VEISYEVNTIAGESPLHKAKHFKKSKIKSVEFYWNKAKPFAKTKYIFVTYREQVL